MILTTAQRRLRMHRSLCGRCSPCLYLYISNCRPGSCGSVGGLVCTTLCRPRQLLLRHCHPRHSATQNCARGAHLSPRISASAPSTLDCNARAFVHPVCGDQQGSSADNGRLPTVICPPWPLYDARPVMSPHPAVLISARWGINRAYRARVWRLGYEGRELIATA